MPREQRPVQVCHAVLVQGFVVEGFDGLDGEKARFGEGVAGRGLGQHDVADGLEVVGVVCSHGERWGVVKSTREGGRFFRRGRGS